MGTTAGAHRALDGASGAEPTPTLLGAPKRTLVSPAGESYLDRRRQLGPRWTVVWTQLFAGHLVLAAVIVAFALWGPGWSWWAIPAALAGGAVIGFTLHYIVLFQHEAAHYNLAPGRRANDLLCDLTIGVLIGEPIAAYRPVHLAHHRLLGTPGDTERSYFEAPNLRFAIQGLTGIRLLRTLAHRSQVRAAAGSNTPRRLPIIPAAAALVTITIVSLSLAFGRPALAAAWAFGLAVLLPFLISLRQVLEHRSDTARPDVDYSTVPHGATNRLFGTGPLASTLGGAGFNRHLLHHWDPGVSYTRLAEVEVFLVDTSAEGAVRNARTTYLATLRRLLHP